MRRFILVAAALALVASCGDRGGGPVSLSQPETFGGIPIDPNAPKAQLVFSGIQKLDGNDVRRLVEKGHLKPEDLSLEGDLCPTLIDCWYVDQQEFYQDNLWENYCVVPGATHLAVALFKTPGTGPCPINNTNISARWGDADCRDGKPSPLPLHQVLSVTFGPGPVTKGFFFLLIGIVFPAPSGLHDSFWVVDWDGAMPNYDDACGVDVWGPPSGDGAPMRILMIFGPEPPYPPPGFPPCRLPGEDGETRPWCFTA